MLSFETEVCMLFKLVVSIILEGYPNLRIILACHLNSFIELTNGIGNIKQQRGKECS
jgi:hypothetical protein